MILDTTWTKICPLGHNLDNLDTILDNVDTMWTRLGQCGQPGQDLDTILDNLDTILDINNLKWKQIISKNNSFRRYMMSM